MAAMRTRQSDCAGRWRIWIFPGWIASPSGTVMTSSCWRAARPSWRAASPEDSALARATLGGSGAPDAIELNRRLAVLTDDGDGGHDDIADPDLLLFRHIVEKQEGDSQLRLVVIE